jgi:hypothetical protein
MQTLVPRQTPLEHCEPRVHAALDACAATHAVPLQKEPDAQLASPIAPGPLTEHDVKQAVALAQA